MRIPLVRLAAMLLAAASLHGCATLSEGECRQADWRELGREDGRQGYPQSRLQDHREACAKYALAPAERDYLEGRNEGLPHYCRAENGYRVGRSGGYYHGVCPAQDEPAFLALYERGREIHDVVEELSRLQSRIDAQEIRLSGDNLSAEQREYARRELYRLYREYDSLRRYLVRLEHASRLGRTEPSYFPAYP